LIRAESTLINDYYQLFIHKNGVWLLAFSKRVGKIAKTGWLIKKA